MIATVTTNIEAGICCVDYDDILRLTLPRNLLSLASITVITAPWDHNTIAIAEQAGVKVFITDAWKVGGPFNKGRALNQWIQAVQQTAGEQIWLLSLDADIMLLRDYSISIADLDPTCLYSARRRMCLDHSTFQEFTSGKRPLLSFDLDMPEIRNGMVWGHRPTSNPAALSGYFQLWCPASAAGASVFDETGTAAKYDVQFALSFPSDHRRYLDPLEVLHLGPAKTNWEGRKSSRWD